MTWKVNIYVERVSPRELDDDNLRGALKAVIVARTMTYMRETLRTVESEGKPCDALVWRLK